MSEPESLQDAEQEALTNTPAPVPDEDILQLIHQLNQPLTAISNYAQAGQQLMESGKADTQLMAELFGKIIAQCSRTFIISQQLSKTINSRT